MQAIEEVDDQKEEVMNDKPKAKAKTQKKEAATQVREVIVLPPRTMRTRRRNVA